MYVMVQPFVTGLRNPKKPVIAMVTANARDRHTRKFHQHCEDTIIPFPPLPSAINPLPLLLSFFLSSSNKPYSNRRMGMAYLRAPPSLSQRRARTPQTPFPEQAPTQSPDRSLPKNLGMKKKNPRKRVPPPPPPPHPQKKTRGASKRGFVKWVFFFVFGLAFQGKHIIIVFRFNSRVY